MFHTKTLFYLTLFYSIWDCQVYGEDYDWNYYEQDQWGELYPTCEQGERQSPILFLFENATQDRDYPEIEFYNYDNPLPGPLVIKNTGRLVKFDIPASEDENEQPYIIGGPDRLRWDPVRVEYHWKNDTESESLHQIKTTRSVRRFDAEMHIVHKNAKYSTFEEAEANEDGLLILAVGLYYILSFDYSTFEKIANVLPAIEQYNTEATIEESLTLSELIGKVNRGEFLFYSGSLTYPPCTENIIYYVLVDSIAISNPQRRILQSLQDETGEPTRTDRYYISNPSQPYILRWTR